MIGDVSEQEFQAKVIERSKQVPVVVDFWAEWCGPCRTLGPALEDAVRKRGGEVELAKVDTDANQTIAREFGIQSIPAVKAFKDGKVVAEFIGAQPPAAIESFLNEFVPSEADRLSCSPAARPSRRSSCFAPSRTTLLPTAWQPAPSSRPPRTGPAPPSSKQRSPPGTAGIRATRSRSCRPSSPRSRTPSGRISCGA